MGHVLQVPLNARLNRSTGLTCAFRFQYRHPSNCRTSQKADKLVEKSFTIPFLFFPETDIFTGTKDENGT
jgi:hypothetical protein